MDNARGWSDKISILKFWNVYLSPRTLITARQSTAADQQENSHLFLCKSICKTKHNHKTLSWIAFWIENKPPTSQPKKYFLSHFSAIVSTYANYHFHSFIWTLRQICIVWDLCIKLLHKITIFTYFMQS